MNWKMHRYTLGRVMYVEAALLLVPLIVGIICQDGPRVVLAYLISSLVAALFGFALSFKKPEVTKLYTKDGLVIVTLIWVLFSVFGAFPFMIAGDIPSFWDAYFETASGFTTTGASILPAVEEISKASIFWQAFTHLTGGMGVLVFALAILPSFGADSIHIMKAEVAGPTFGKLNSKTKDTAKRLYTIYFGMTTILIVLLLLAGMNLFDALVHAFSTAGTGGFASHNLSVAYFDSALIEMILAFGMLLFGVNFNLYHLALINKGKGRKKSEELRWYIGIVAITTILIAINILPQYVREGQNFLRSLRDSFFTVSSIITTTGFGTADFNLWPVFSKTILLFLMFVGAMAGSTGGGLKVSRVAMLVKSSIQGIRASREPKRALPLRFEGEKVSKETLLRLFQYFIIYVLIFTSCLLIVSLDKFDFTESFSAVTACFNNIGPGLNRLGPRGSFAEFSPLSKMTLSFAMIAGRLEIYPMLMLLSLPKIGIDTLKNNKKNADK